MRSAIICRKLIPRVRHVISRIRSLNLSRAFRRNASLAPVIRNAESENFAFLGSRYRAFGLVDFQAELVGQEPAYRGPHALAGVVAANINVTVISVTATTSSQFLVEIVEHDITEEGRERTALRGPFVHRSDQTVFQYPGIHECPDMRIPLDIAHRSEMISPTIPI
ncbi:hypothetical protein ABIC02_007947 [Bradyrhizobium sp. RT5a]